LPYGYFQAYLRLGALRTLKATAAEVGKSLAYMEDLSGRYDWSARAMEYDNYVMNAEVDGAAEWAAHARTETQGLADKLRNLLSDRLDDCISKRQDPTIRWTQAATLLLKMQESGTPPVENKSVAEQIDRVTQMLEKITGGAPE
jgi:hypothetical protein